MTVQGEISRQEFNCTGATDYALSAGFAFFDATDLTVYREDADGNVTTLVLTTDYTVSGGSGSNGTVTTVATYSDGKLIIARDVPYTQDMDMVQGDGFAPDTLERQMDKMVMMAQDLKRRVDRSLTLPDSDTTGAFPAMPTPEPGRFIRWSGDNPPELENSTLVNLGGVESTTLAYHLDTVTALRSFIAYAVFNKVQCLGYYTKGDGGGGPLRYYSSGQPAGTYVDNGGSIIVPTGGDGSAAWLWEWAGPINVEWFGAKFDGTTNDTTAIRSAVSCAYSNNIACVEFPSGTAIVSGSIWPVAADTTAEIELRGQGAQVYGGTTIKTTGTNLTILPIQSAGVVIRGIRFYGDGTTYGATATNKGIEARGAQVGSEWNLDMMVIDCTFVYLAEGIRQSGKNLTVINTLFSNSLNGIYVTKETGATETRGLVLSSGCRFHSIGGQSVAAKAIYFDPAADFLDVQIGDVYADDCYSLMEGFAGPLTITSFMGSRNWGGFNLDTTGRTLTEIGKNQVNISNLVLHFITTATVADGFKLYSHVDLFGTINGFSIFNPSGHGMFLDSAANKVLELQVTSGRVRDPGDGGAYDCLRLGAEVAGVQLDSLSLEKGGSTSTGYGLKTVGPRTAAAAIDLANIFGQDIRITGFAAANRISIGNTKDFGGDSPIRNTYRIQTVTLDQNFSITVGSNDSTIHLTGTLTAGRNLTINDSNVYDGARFRICRTGGGAFNWTILANGGTVATLATNQYCEVVYSSPIENWLVIAVGTL